MLPTGKRYVRYGVYSRGKFHIMAAEPQGMINPTSAFDALCGATSNGSSPCTATSDTLAQVGRLSGSHVCKRCIAVLA